LGQQRVHHLVKLADARVQHLQGVVLLWMPFAERTNFRLKRMSSRAFVMLSGISYLSPAAP